MQHNLIGINCTFLVHPLAVSYDCTLKGKPLFCCSQVEIYPLLAHPAIISITSTSHAVEYFGHDKSHLLYTLGVVANEGLEW